MVIYQTHPLWFSVGGVLSFLKTNQVSEEDAFCLRVPEGRGLWRIHWSNHADKGARHPPLHCRCSEAMQEGSKRLASTSLRRGDLKSPLADGPPPRSMILTMSAPPGRQGSRPVSIRASVSHGLSLPTLLGSSKTGGFIRGASLSAYISWEPTDWEFLASTVHWWMWTDGWLDETGTFVSGLTHMSKWLQMR